MPTRRIIVAIPTREEPLARLRALPGAEVIVVEPFDEPRTLPAEILRGASALACSLPPSNWTDAADMRWIQVASAGYSQLLPLKLHERGVRATNASGVFDGPIGEWNVAMMVNLARDLRGMLRNQEAGTWDRDARFQREIRGNTLGIWGYGGIGRETARLAKTLGLRVHVLARGDLRQNRPFYRVPGTGDPEGIYPDATFRPEQKEAFLRDLDFLVLSLPLNPATEGIVGEAELRALPPRAFLLNPARGPLVKQEILLRALREKWIAGAALDTHYAYPMPPDHPLWKFPNVIMTPHISGSTGSPRFLDRLWDIVLENAARWLDGRPLLNELTATQLSGA
jgi:phosphoglycerate dehydrogenase-like enzyme